MIQVEHLMWKLKTNSSNNTINLKLQISKFQLLLHFAPQSAEFVRKRSISLMYAHFSEFRVKLLMELLGKGIRQVKHGGPEQAQQIRQILKTINFLIF